MTMIKLKSGKEVPEGTYKITTMILGQFFKNAGPIAMYELVEKCKNSNHTMFGVSGDKAKESGLIENGRIHDVIRDIILSTVSFEKGTLEMKIHFP